jgi:hypothetical protein
MRRNSNHIDWFLEEFDKLNDSDRKQLLEQFRIEHAKTPGDKHFCSLIQAPIVVPCQLKSCEARIENKALMNCGLFYRAVSKRPAIDLAKTYSITEERAKLLIVNAVRKLRVASLEETISQKKLNQYYLIPSNICVNCGAHVDSTTFKAGKFKYCSKICFQERPPELLRLEYMFKTDIRSVLSVSQQLFKSVLLISNVLKIPRTHLLKYYERFLGIKPHEFGSDVVDLIDLLRKRVPTPSIENFIVIDASKLRANKTWSELDKIGNSLISSL